VIRVLAVDDHPLLRDGIAALIAGEDDMELIGEASNALGAIRSEFPEARIIVLTTHPGDVQVSRALKAGARAYLLKGELRKALLETIRAVHSGQKRLSSEVASEIAEHATDGALTPREIEVLRLIAAGNANKEIGAQLSLAEVTIKSHVKNVLAKLGANDRTHAVTIALKRGIIDL
jgi:DNA-binding NarL/FixJ family response regulator